MMIIRKNLVGMIKENKKKKHSFRQRVLAGVILTIGIVGMASIINHGVQYTTRTVTASTVSSTLSSLRRIPRKKDETTSRDREITTFNLSGRLLQTDYAMMAATSITSNCVVAAQLCKHEQPDDNDRIAVCIASKSHSINNNHNNRISPEKYIVSMIIYG